MPVEIERETVTNIAAYLPAMAEKQPESLAVACPVRRGPGGKTDYAQYSFAELNRESDILACGLEKIGIGQGVRTVLMVKPSLEFFALTFAIFKARAVPVLVDPGMGIHNLKQCLHEAEPVAFIGISKAHAARVILRWASSTLKHLVTVGRRWFWGGHSLSDVRRRGDTNDSFVMKDTNPDDIAAILFTSGSTGVPKGAVYTHSNFIAQVEALRMLYDIQPGEIDLPTFPLFALFDPALGMSAIIPDMDATRPGLVEPRNILEPIERFSVTNMFGSPALIRRVAYSNEAEGNVLNSLKRVISAGAPVPSEVIERFGALLPADAQIHTPYGATESLPVTSIGSEEILGETRYATDAGKGVCVGRPVDEAEVSVIRITDEAIEEWSEDLRMPDGEIGEITVRGPMVTRQYFNRDESTRLAKIRDTDDSDGGVFHRMGDLGYFDEEGRLWFCGRKAHRVQTENETLFTVPCESVFNVHEKVFRTALVGVGKAGLQKPVLCVELLDGSTVWATVRDALQKLGEQHAHTGPIQTFLKHPSFPVDIRHNAKIFREKLAVWAEEQLR
ncbi:MAG: fatty acid CoA ligase family protein [Planctomycetota bacterium]|jgi:acyl-CoA synthetase (AMP-forming)/AMP-acid ligase II|nr:fatty acid CoA ligase family protein [Planctomycetota bacterium]